MGISSLDSAEEWRSVLGFEGKYEVSSRGRVRSVNHTTHMRNGRVCRYRGRIRKIRKHTNGYYYVGLWDRKLVCRRVHGLVADAFLRPRRPGEQLNHLDADKSNNAAVNLEICTAKQNTAHAMRLGLRRWGIKLTESDVVAIKALRGTATHGQIASQFGVSRPTVSLILAGDIWKHVA